VPRRRPHAMFNELALSHLPMVVSPVGQILVVG
jgi:hypothetical protein